MTGLLVIDIQNFYENMLVDFEKTCANAAKIINKFREDNLPIFYIQHIKKIPVLDKLVPLEKIEEFQIHKSFVYLLQLILSLVVSSLIV